MYLFSNNAKAILAVALTDDSGDPDFGTIEVVADGSEDTFQSSFSAGQSELATLTRSDTPGVFEVVRITARSGGTFTVERGYEMSPGLSAPPAWASGTVLEARITAALLRGFPQKGPNAAYLSYDGRLVRPVADTGQGEFAFAGYPMLHDRRRSPTSGSAPSSQDLVFAPEIVGGSIPVDLGVAAGWAEAAYYPLAVVAPASPDGFQYFLDLAEGASSSWTDVPPVFNGNTDVTIAYDGYSPNEVPAGFWVPTALPVDITTRMVTDARLVLTEVGFMARAVSASTTPHVSIGTNSDPTKFVNNQQLTQITSSHQVHRFPITAGGEMVEYLRFKVDTAATGGVFRGRFYWRGFFLNDYE